ncbi:MAG TPA: stage V sporulation protein D [Thermoanaerobacterales bacterium]|uniref:stage V sporulation protein D n=1 Tax=Tepidanaerobacter sp. GT38 TaxID=2722793 RepID=UPI0017AEF07D|nr:stage V sporulation protein D [Tepidanaerobacter sp. GT38]MCG1012161.1 stage V sporulation protein D [Tepidanaerobacter sp. GT38]HHY42379.1 stage V sporulation protein D [Thermoanaerobacterales bacterium]
MSVPQIVIKRRLVVLLLFSFMFSFILLGRVFWIQFVLGDELKDRALNQWTSDVPIEPKRGTIYDRNKNPLAISATVDTVVASPPDIKDIEKTASLLSTALNLDKEELEEKLKDAKDKKKGAIYIKRKISDEESEAVRNLNLSGIYFTKENKRFYPERNLCSHVLGFTGIDSQGLDGIELIYEKYLKGTPGRIVSEKDALSRKLPFGIDKYVPPEDGLDLVLTIDKIIQHIAERELEKALAEHNAKRGTVIVMDPKTGEILALTNKPDYDPNNYSEYPQQLWRNAAVSDVYEPGSTFKIVTASAALEEGVARPEDTFYDPGYVIVSGVRIGCWRHEGHGSQTFIQLVENSCNPGFVDLGMKLGKDRMIKYIKGFGFGETTGVDLPGEARGILDPSKVGPVELATISFGQGISVTPIQLITALSTIANDGKLVQPHVAKAIIDKDGNIVHEFSPAPLRQVVSYETAQEMKKILESVVTNGTGGRGKVEGYRVAGKTGTAEKYVPGKYVVSYAGFAPVDDPKLAILVIIDEPSGGLIYGGTIAGPVFQKIMADSLNYLGVEPQIEIEEEEKEYIAVPDLRNLYIEDAKKILFQNGLSARVDGEGYVVTEQVPMPGAEVKKNTTVLLKVSDSRTNKDPVTIPDLTGRTVKESTDILNAIGLNIEIVGSGYAVKQTPPPEVEVGLGTTVRVEFSQNP